MATGIVGRVGTTTTFNSPNTSPPPTTSTSQTSQTTSSTMMQQLLAALQGLGGANAGGPMPPTTMGGGGFWGGGGTPASGGGGYASYGDFPPPTPLPQIPRVQMPNIDAAQSAAFAKAKDMVGQQGRAAVSSVADELGGRGMGGSGMEAQAIRDTIQSGAGQLGDVSRAQAIEKSNLASDFAKLGYMGDLQQRGQDLAQALGVRGQDIERLLGLRGQDVTQRGQDIGANTSQWLAQSNSQTANNGIMAQLLGIILGSFGGGL